MIWNDIDWEPTAGKLRRFGWWGTLMLGIAAAWSVTRQQWSTAALWTTTAALIFVLAAARPASLRGLWIGLTVLSFPLGVCVFWLLSAVMYFGLITVMGIVLRMTGRDPLQLRRRAGGSYWKPKAAPGDVRSYYRQF